MIRPKMTGRIMIPLLGVLIALGMFPAHAQDGAPTPIPISAPGIPGLPVAPGDISWPVALVVATYFLRDLKIPPINTSNELKVTVALDQASRDWIKRRMADVLGAYTGKATRTDAGPDTE